MYVLKIVKFNIGFKHIEQLIGYLFAKIAGKIFLKTKIIFMEVQEKVIKFI